MSDRQLTPEQEASLRPVWKMEPGETVLRELPVDRKKRDKGEVDNPVQRVFSFLFFAGFGVWILFSHFANLGESGPNLWTFVALAFGGGAIALGVMLARKKPPTAWSNMERYILLDQKLVLIDESERLVDQVRRDEIEDVVLQDDHVSVLRIGDDELVYMFNINYVDKHEDVFEFVRETYT